MKTNANYHRHTIYITLLLFGLAGCQPAKDKEATQEANDSIPASSTAFKPNPQQVAEVEVKTLGIGAVAPPFRLPDVSGKFYTLDDFMGGKCFVKILRF